jgi:hypothetical protein
MSDHFNDELNLAGPCGFYCGTCSHFLARSKGMLAEKHLKHGCKGCRIQDKQCAWVKKDCSLLRKHQVTFCFECPAFPCSNLRQLDARHRRDDNMSLIENSPHREVGPELWLLEQVKMEMPQVWWQPCVIDRECLRLWL